MRLVRLDPEIERGEFTCGDDDLDEYYRVDSIQGAKELISVSYAIVDDADTTTAFFSLSNDSIKKELLPRSAYKRLLKSVPHGKRYSSMPAAKIGRLGVSSSSSRRGHGTWILDFIKYWFTHGNKTGCRFLLVDAYNTDRPLGFYRKNGFQFLTVEDKSKDTRIMYFDLVKFRE